MKFFERTPPATAQADPAVQAADDLREIIKNISFFTLPNIKTYADYSKKWRQTDWKNICDFLLWILLKVISTYILCTKCQILLVSR